MQKANNFAILMAFIKRCLSNSSSKGNKHYTFSVRHIKTELNNCSYLVKKTTAIPREISCYNTIDCWNILPKSDLQNFYHNSSLNCKMIFSFGEKIQEGNKYLHDLLNKLISPYPVQEELNNSSDGLSARNDNIMNSCLDQGPINPSNTLIDKNIEIEPSKQQAKGSVFTFKYDSEKGYIKDDPFYHSSLTCFEAEQKDKTNSFVNLNEIDETKRKDPRLTSDDCFEEQWNTQKNINGLSASNVEELAIMKIIDLMLLNSKPNEMYFNNMLILNPKSHTKPIVVYLKEKGLYVMQSENMSLDYEIKNYIKGLEKCESNGIFTERVNLIRFYKMPYLDCFLDVLPNNDSSFSTLFLSDVPELLNNKSNPNFSNTIESVQSSLTNLGENGHNITLVVQESLPLGSNIDKFWIPAEENEDGKNILKNSVTNSVEIENGETTCIDCDSLSQHKKLLASNSECPISDKATINKDKLIQETVVPNTSISSIINSIDRSAVIIQRDLYITDQIIQKIQKEEENSKQKDLDKKKLQTGRNKLSHKLHLDVNDPISKETETNKAVTPENISYCLLSDDNTKLNSHAEGNKINDLGMFLSLHSIDSNGNMLFNLLDKAGKMISKLSFQSQMSEYKNDIGVNNTDPRSNKDRLKSKSVKTKYHLNDNSRKSNICSNPLHTLNTSNTGIIVPQDTSTNKYKNMPRTKLAQYDNKKVMHPEEPKPSTHRTQYTCNHNIQIKPIECHNEVCKEINQRNELSQCSSSLRYETLKLSNPEKPNPRSYEKIVNNSVTSGSQLSKNEDIKVDNYKKAIITEEKNDLSTVSNNNYSRIEFHGHKIKEKKELAFPIGAMINLPDYSSIVDNTTDCLLNSNTSKNNIAQNIYIPNNRKFGSSTTNSSSNKHVDHITKTTISSIKKNNFTDIKVSEVETFVDSRLPIPFSTETFFQIFGTNSSLRDHSAIIDITKYKLSLHNKATGYITNLDVMAKLDDIERSIKQLNIHAKAPFLSKNPSGLNESDVPPKKGISSSANGPRNEKKIEPNLKNITTGKKANDTNGVEKLPFMIHKQERLSPKTNDFKWVNTNKFDQINNNSKLMVNKHKHKGKGKNSLIVSDQNVINKEIGQIKTDAGVKTPEKIVPGYYIDLFNFYKSDKASKKSKFPISKKSSIYDQKGFSNRDRKILKEIKSEIQKHRANRKRINKQSVRSATNRRIGNKILKRPSKTQSIGILNGSKKQKTIDIKIRLPIISDKKNQSDVKMSNLPGPHLEKSKQSLPNARQKNQEAKEEQKNAENAKYKIQKITNNNSSEAKSIASNLNQNINYPVKFDKQLQKPLLVSKTSKANEHIKVHFPKKKEVKKIDSAKSILKNRDLDTKLVEVEKYVSLKPGSSIKNSEHKQTVIENTEKKINKLKNYDEKSNDEMCNKNPLCYTYIATEAYINKPEKIKSIPDKPFSFPSFSKLLEKSPPPPPQKVTILEKYNKIVTAEDKEIQETFRKDLIKKSQKKIELKSGIDFRFKTSKVKAMKSKLKLLKRNKQKREISPVSMDGKVQLVTKEVKKNTDVRTKPRTQKTYISDNSKMKNIELNKSLKPPAKINLKNKQEISSVKYSMKKEPGKTVSQNMQKRKSNIKASSKSFKNMSSAENLSEKESSKKYNLRHDSPAKDIASAKSLVKKEPSKKPSLKNRPSSKAFNKTNSKVKLEPVTKTEKNATKVVDKSHFIKGGSRSQNKKKKSIAGANEPVTASQEQVTVTQVPIVSHEPIAASQEQVTVTQVPVIVSHEPINVDQGSVVTQEPVTVTKKLATGTQQQFSVQTKIANRKDFPMLLIDVDKMSKEIKPELDLNKCQKSSVVHEKITNFPLHNTKKRLLFPRATQVLNLDPSRDPVLHKEFDSLPSVTKILNTTIPENSREILREWRRSMIDELGEDGFRLFYKGQLVNGSKFHSQLYTHLLAGHPSLEESSHLSLKSIQNVLRRLTDISAVNSHVVHRKLSYRGVVDCVAKYQNKPVLIEWKRLENPQVKVVNSSLDVASVQLSAYVGAVNFDDAYKFQLSGGLIVIAYNDGSEAEVIEINKDQCTVHWKEWLKRLQQFQKSLDKKQN